MSILHTVNKSPFEKNSLSECLTHALDGSAILLLEDGVYAAMQGTNVEADVKNAVATKKVYALGADVKLRGLSTDRMIDGVELIDYAGFVDLTESNDKVQSWL
ncbi:MAG: sulfurtransferase complex subunit TusB [Chromatiales bacterium]|jgi:tRNA 2-thiouridine synthesizing protein B